MWAGARHAFSLHRNGICWGAVLDKVLSRGDHKVPLKAALQLALELADALDCAHGQGVVHRDLKPANILLTEDGHAKIADFGVAKLNLANHTLAGRALGTPAYMSPEQLNGEVVDGRSDLFSLGVLLYTVLTGYNPFQGNSAITVSFKVVNRDPMPATLLDTELPQGLDYIIARAMAKDPAERYQRGMEMVLDIQELQQQREPWSKAKLPGPPASRSAVRTAKERDRLSALGQLWVAIRHGQVCRRTCWRRCGRGLLPARAFDWAFHPWTRGHLAWPPRIATASQTGSTSRGRCPGQNGGDAGTTNRCCRSGCHGVHAANANRDCRFGCHSAPANRGKALKAGSGSPDRRSPTKTARASSPSLSPLHSFFTTVSSPTVLFIFAGNAANRGGAQFRGRHLSIWVDEVGLYARVGRADNKHLFVFHHVSGHEFHTMQVSPGKTSSPSAGDLWCHP